MAKIELKGVLIGNPYCENIKEVALNKIEGNIATPDELTIEIHPYFKEKRYGGSKGGR